MNNDKCYKLSFLMDVTNIQEFTLMIGLFIITSILIYYVYQNRLRIQRIGIKNNQEKIEILRINSLIYYCLVFQLLSDTIELIGFFQQQTSIIPAIYYGTNLIYIVLFYICLWESSLIWLDLMRFKHSSRLLLKCTTWFRLHPIVQVLLMITTVTMYVMYIVCQTIPIATMLFVISTIILLVFVIVAILFFKLILTQNAIPQKSKTRVRNATIGLIIAISARIVWNIILAFYDLEEFKDYDSIKQSDVGWNWFYYLLIYLPLANILPMYFLNRIYQPQTKPQQDLLGDQ